MKKFFALFLFVFSFFIPSLVMADEAWVIKSFNSDIDIQDDGVVRVIEGINVDFGSSQKHGIFRDIPYIYSNGDEKTYTEINIKNVLQNGNVAEYQVSRINGQVRVRIGDPDLTISGENSYVIEYSALGVLKSFADYDEFYWNVTGNNWEVPIERASAEVSLPRDILTKADCFEGYAGSTESCKFNTQSGESVNFETTEHLKTRQGLTVVVGYEKEIIPLLEVEKPKSLWDRFIEWPSILSLVSGVVLGFSAVYLVWHNKGRDYWFGNNLFGNRNESGVVKPIGAHETTVVEYIPPEGLRPAEIGVLVDERADTLDVVSTIIDLAERGFLTITEIQKKWMFGKIDYLLKKKKKNQEGLLKYEIMLLDELFNSKKEVKVSSLQKTFYDELKKIKEELYKEVIAKNLFPSNPEKIRIKYLAIAIVLILLGMSGVFLAISIGQVFLLNLMLSLVASAIALLILSKFMPRRSAYGRHLYRRVKGYRLFIDRAEKHRQIFFENKNMINEVLPYAIMFGLTGKFAKAMDTMGMKPQNMGWYTGAAHVNMNTLGESMDGFSKSISSAIASTPSSGGGFSSSGGSSGGGFGGGGGGSW